MIQLYSLKRKTVRPCAKSANKMAADTARAVQKSFTVKVNEMCIRDRGITIMTGMLRMAMEIVIQAWIL